MTRYIVVWIFEYSDWKTHITKVKNASPIVLSGILVDEKTTPTVNYSCFVYLLDKLCMLHRNV